MSRLSRRRASDSTAASSCGREPKWWMRSVWCTPSRSATWRMDRLGLGPPSPNSANSAVIRRSRAGPAVAAPIEPPLHCSPVVSTVRRTVGSPLVNAEEADVLDTGRSTEDVWLVGARVVDGTGAEPVDGLDVHVVGG